MTKEPMVTRTITTTRVTLLGMNVVTGESENVTVDLPGTYKDVKAMFKAAEKAAETIEYKPVVFVAHEVIKRLYAMTVSDFITFATVIPARNKSAN